MDNWVLAGHVWVDSGQLGISDPCYTWDYDKDVLPVALPAIDSNTPHYQVKDGTVFIAPTLHGDGVYPVFVEYDARGKVTKMMVDFDHAEEDDYEDTEGDFDDYDDYDEEPVYDTQGESPDPYWFQ